MELVKYLTDPNGERATAQYQFKHSSVETKTIFSFEIDLGIDRYKSIENKINVDKISFGEIEKPNVDEAFDKLAELFERAAIALRNRKQKELGISLPLGKK